MKKILLLTGMAITIMLQSCFDMISEITINADGSGKAEYTTDMSRSIAAMKQFAKDDASKLNKKVDSTIAFSKLLENQPNVPEEYKNLIKDGTLSMKLDMEKEISIMKMNFNFGALSDINKLRTISQQFDNSFDKKDSEGKQDTTMKQVLTSLSAAFDETFEKGKITRRMNKEKYNEFISNQQISMMSSMAGGDDGVKFKIIYHLPSAATKVSGAGVSVSDDKKTVTINNTFDQYFNEPEKIEYSIEY